MKDKDRLNLESIKKLAEEDKFIISNHARVKMFQRNVSTKRIEYIIKQGEIIEEYIDDKPCPSCLILGFAKGIPYHIVVAQCADHIRVVTVYTPDEAKWVNYRKRKGGGET